MIDINNIKTPKNLELAYTRLITNPEATYKNYFRHIYAAYGMALSKNLKNLSLKIKAGFLPYNSYRVFAPKPNGLSRVFTILSIEDQIVYQAFANKLADQMQVDKVVNRYKKRVFGNLYNGKGNQFFFMDWESSFKAYTRAIFQAYDNGNNYIASFDLTACYDSINHRLIRDILIHYHFSENCADYLIRLLEKWCSSDSKYLIGVGIPQGPQASGVFAEAILGEYDDFLEKLQKFHSFEFFRYVDDIRILAKDEETVKLVLFLLDLKSKELGLFPQSSKITAHKIVDISEEVKQISKPLFEEDDEETVKAEKASKALTKLVKQKSNDITSIKRYFQYLEPCAKNNSLAIKLMTKYPDTIHSFVYYVQRYPRKIPTSIVSFIKDNCSDRTKQYLSGQLLSASTNNISRQTTIELGNLAYSILLKESKEKFIYDPLFKEQLYLLLVLSGRNTKKTFVMKVKKEQSWWIRQQLIQDLIKCSAPDQIVENVVSISLMDNNPDDALVAAMNYIVKPEKYKLPKTALISSLAQESLKKAGIIHRSKYTTSQINNYIEIITGRKCSLPWKKVLGNSHDAVERSIFMASCYWSTDITAFVNIWDSIDDAILNALYNKHRGLGTYALGNVGSIIGSTRLIAAFPVFYKLIKEIHALRLSSYLSHSKVRSTGQYTGPIPYREKKRILKLLINGLTDLESNW